MDAARFRSLATAQISEAAHLIQANTAHIDRVVEVAERLIECFEQDGRVFICGNGGSAADALHIAGEYLGRVERNRRPLPCFALTADVASLTGIGNDFGFDEIFGRQVEALGRRGDCVILLSTSGRSDNVIVAAKAAAEGGLVRIGFTGRRGGDLAALCDVAVQIDSENPGRIQEAYMNLLHVASALVEDHFSGQ